VAGGSDRPALLLHRPLGGSMALWGAFSERLAAAFRVIAFDPRGVGSSSDVPYFFGTRQMAADAVALLEHLKLGRVHVFGLSLGGMVASWMAADAPERTAHLILASSIPEIEAASRRALRWVVPVVHALAKGGPEMEVELVRAVLSPEFRELHPDRVLEIERVVRACPARRRNLLLRSIAAARHVQAPISAERIPNALLLFGALDPLAGPRSEGELRRELPHAMLKRIPGAGHDVSLEKPELAAAHIVSFIGK
jgi:pimeloyl-ACP methyl ester carboxylesterase